MSEQLPKDPNILLSTVNMKLRNQFSSKKKLCTYYQLEALELDTTMKNIGYYYDEEQNQYRMNE